jgi:predicted Zn-ribbon and HTH transcriptional regulator
MKRETRKIEPRVCRSCGYDFGTESPLPWSADCHVIGGELVTSCSPPCRLKMGVPERKLR